MNDTMEVYDLQFLGQSYKAIKVTRLGDSIFNSFWLPKSQIEVDTISQEEDFALLKNGEIIAVYIPDWLAEEKELL